MDKILKTVGDYYSEKIVNNGVSSEGVDWNSKESHYLRFEQLTKYFDINKETSVLDYGSGYGALIDFFKEQKVHYKEYYGFDISKEMIEKGNELFQGERIHLFDDKKKLDHQTFDYVIANGIFNVKLEIADEDWNQYILDTLHEFDKVATKGFSFNILTSYSDEEYKKDYLHYADPMFYFDYCKRYFSRNVALLHDYELYEFTLLIRR